MSVVDVSPNRWRFCSRNMNLSQPAAQVALVGAIIEAHPAGELAEWLKAAVC